MKKSIFFVSVLAVAIAALVVLAATSSLADEVKLTTIVPDQIVRYQPETNSIWIGKNTAPGLNNSGNYNMAIGDGALQNVTTGIYNSAFGYQAGMSVLANNSNSAFGTNALRLTGSGDVNQSYNNSAFGVSALASNIGGNENSAFGCNAMSATTGSDNCAFGMHAMAVGTGGGYNAAFGYKALYNVTGYWNNAFGQNALFANTSGKYNCAFGDLALQANTTAGNNCAFGMNALMTNTTGAYNCAFGGNALKANTVCAVWPEGSLNSAFGEQSLLNNTTGYTNAAFGYYALAFNTTGFWNTAVGGQAGCNNTTSVCNTYVGYRAGDYNKTGQWNTYIGTASNPSDPALTNISGATAIGGGATVTRDNEICLGSRTDIHPLICNLDSGLGTDMKINGSNQIMRYSSSKRYKHDITPYATDIDGLYKLNPVNFKWNTDTGSPNVQDFGLIAEDVYEVYPELVALDKEGRPESVGYDKISVILVKHAQKQKEIIDGQQREIDALKTGFDGLKKEMAELKHAIEKK
jgi:hypothetical protein